MQRPRVEVTAMMTTDALEIREIVRNRCVHFDVEAEMSIRGSQRVKVGFEVRLWGVHPKGARALPGCPKCWDLVDDLRRIADAVVPADEDPTDTEVDPFRPALYESRVVPGADEVSVTIHLFHRDGTNRPVDASEEQRLKDIRARLHALGVPERS